MNDTSTRRSASRDVPGRHGRTSILSCRTDRGTSHAPARAENGAHADEVREAMTETVVVGNASDHGAPAYRRRGGEVGRPSGWRVTAGDGDRYRGHDPQYPGERCLPGHLPGARGTTLPAGRLRALSTGGATRLDGRRGLHRPHGSL